jgi:predicted TPR repeat methyltransferase
MFSGHYDSWITSRLNGVKKYIPEAFFKGKTLLELGCGHAHNGNKFYEMGAIVTSSDVRKEHLDTANKLYPHIKTVVIDTDKDIIQEKYDIILHWGVLYHMREIEVHLEMVAQKCDVLLLETEVCDSDDNTFYISRNETGYDQAFNHVGIRPSASYVERVLEKNGFNFYLVNDSILNASFHNYTWEIRNTKTWHSGMRRFWICWKNVESPISVVQ